MVDPKEDKQPRTCGIPEQHIAKVCATFRTMNASLPNDNVSRYASLLTSGMEYGLLFWAGVHCTIYECVL